MLIILISCLRDWDDEGLLTAPWQHMLDAPYPVAEICKLPLGPGFNRSAVRSKLAGRKKAAEHLRSAKSAAFVSRVGERLLPLTALGSSLPTCRKVFGSTLTHSLTHLHESGHTTRGLMHGVGNEPFLQTQIQKFVWLFALTFSSRAHGGLKLHATTQGKLNTRLLSVTPPVPCQASEAALL